jgi:orotate phosphoribosyltransferase
MDIIEALKKILCRTLMENSFKYSKDNLFTLSSGRLSPFYINCKKTTLTSKGAYLIGNILSTMIASDIDAIGGLTLGADPIAVATVTIAASNSRTLNSFIIRKEPKTYGTQSQIEGPVSPGNNVIICEDVVTTGASTIKAIKVAESYGLNIKKVITLIDREEDNGKRNIEKCGYPLISLFTLNDLFNLYKVEEKKKL